MAGVAATPELRITYKRGRIRSHSGHGLLISQGIKVPTYEYACNGNEEHRFEKFQTFSEPPVESCPVCGAGVRRLIFAPPIVFKGPGFFRTDNRPKSDSNGEKDSTESKTETAAAAD